MKPALLFLMLGAACTAAPLAEPPNGDPRGALVFENLTHAQDLLERALAAHGGAQVFEGAATWRVSTAGHFDFQAHLAQPWASRRFAFDGELVWGPAHALVRIQGAGPFTHDAWYAQPWSHLPEGAPPGATLGPGDSAPTPLQGADLAAERDLDLAALPWLHLAEARAAAGSLARLPAPHGFDALGYTDSNGARKVLIFERASHLLVRVERLAHWEGKGDRLDRVVFEDYPAGGDFPLPRTVRWHLEALTTQVDATLRLEAPKRIPEDALGELVAETWPAFELPAASAPPALLQAHDLGAGVHVLELPDVDGRALLVDLGEGAAVIESGGTSASGAAILRTAAALLPDKPVRYLAMSHHHRISAQGLRPFVHAGVTLLATAGNVDYLRELATRPYRIAPDAQARAPREPKIEVIGERHVLGDGRLELHMFTTSTHTDEYVFSFVPALGLGSVGDLVYLRPESSGSSPQKASSRTLALFDLVAERGLDVRTLVQTWPLDDVHGAIPWSTIEGLVRRARP